MLGPRALGLEWSQRKHRVGKEAWGQNTEDSAARLVPSGLREVLRVSEEGALMLRCCCYPCRSHKRQRGREKGCVAQMLLRCLGKAAKEAPSQPTGGWHRQVSPALALKTELGGQAGWDALPTHLRLLRQLARWHSPRMLVGIPSSVWSMSCTSRYRWITYASSSSSTNRVGARVSGETL